MEYIIHVYNPFYTIWNKFRNTTFTFQIKTQPKNLSLSPAPLGKIIFVAYKFIHIKLELSLIQSNTEFCMFFKNIP